MTGFLILTVVLYIGSFSLSLAIHKNITKIIPIIFASFFLLEYLLIIIFQSVYFAVYVAIGIIICASLIFIVGNRRIIILHFRTKCLSGTICYCLLVILCLTISIIHGQDPFLWDEFAHWGQMSKEIFRLDYFYITQNTTLTFHNDYPPLPALITSVSSIVEGSFNILYGYALMFLCCMSFLLPFIKESNKNSYIKFLLVLFFAFLFILASDEAQPSLFLSIYPDTLLAISSGYAIYIASKKIENWLCALELSIFLCFITLIKQSALIFILIILCILFYALFKSKKISNIKFLFLILLIPIVFYFSWKYIYQNSYAYFTIASQFNEIPDNINNVITNININTLIYYFRCILVTNLIGWSYIPVSYFILYIFSIILCIYIKKTAHISTFQIIILATFIFTIYAFFMLYSYLFLFKGDESTNLACFKRYMNTGIIAIYIYIFYTINDANKTLTFKNNKKINILILVVIIIYSIICLPKFNFYNHYYTDVTWAKNTSTKLDELLKNKSKVFVINKNMTPLEIIELAFYTNNVIVSREIESGIYSNGKWNYDNNKLLNFLSSCDYLYIDNIDDEFIKTYLNILEFDYLQPNSIYRISSSGNKILLSKY